MNEETKKWVLAGGAAVVALAAVAFLFLRGTDNSSAIKPEPVSTPMTAAAMQANIDVIQNNPKIPPAEKETIIAHIKQQVNGTPSDGSMGPGGRPVGK